MTEFSTNIKFMSGFNPDTKELMFPLKNVWSRLTNYFLTRDGKEIWSFYRENCPRKMQDKNGNIKLLGTKYNIHKIFEYTQKTVSWKEWISNSTFKVLYEPGTDNYQEMKKTLDEEYGINAPIAIKKEPGSYLSDIEHNGYHDLNSIPLRKFNKEKFFVGKIDEDIISFHDLWYFDDENLARKECERLAKLNPGNEYVYLQMKGSCKFSLNWS